MLCCAVSLCHTRGLSGTRTNYCDNVPPIGVAQSRLNAVHDTLVLGRVASRGQLVARSMASCGGLVPRRRRPCQIDFWPRCEHASGDAVWHCVRELVNSRGPVEPARGQLMASCGEAA